MGLSALWRTYVDNKSSLALFVYLKAIASTILRRKMIHCSVPTKTNPLVLIQLIRKSILFFFYFCCYEWLIESQKNAFGYYYSITGRWRRQPPKWRKSVCEINELAEPQMQQPDALLYVCLYASKKYYDRGSTAPMIFLNFQGRFLGKF